MKAIITKWHPPGANSPGRISASDGDGNRVYSTAQLSSVELRHRAAVALCHKMGWSGAETLIGGGIKDGYAWVFSGSEVGK